MENPSIILDSRKLDVRKMDGLYTTEINGTPFASQTFNGLASAVGSFYTVQIKYDYIVPEISLVDRLKEILSKASLLVDRQTALRKLETLSDPEAIRIVSIVKSKPVSYGATYISKVLGKKHFSEVSQVDISDLVTSILHRSELLQELSDIVKV